MNIGKLSFDQIIKLSFDKDKTKFAFFGTLLAFFVSGIFTLLIKIIEPFLINTTFLAGLDIVGSFLTALILLIVVLGLNLQLKAELAKAKKKVSLKDILSFIWKMLGSIILYAFFLLVIVAIFFAVSYLSRIPFAGPYLMALLCIPFVALAGYTVLLLIITGKLLLPSIAENQKFNSWEIIKDTFALTKNNWKKVAFNFVLAMLPIFTLALALLIVIGGGYLLYLAFSWALPGLAMLLKISLNIPTSLIGLILTAGTLVIGAYAASLLIVLGTTLIYSIYLDAKK